MEDTIKIEKTVIAKTEIRIICGKCKKPLYDTEHYTIYNGENVNTFEVFPCDCTTDRAKYANQYNI